MSARLHALLIGINRYPFLNGRDLKGCRNDVQLVAGVLEQRFGLAEEDKRCLFDEEATREGILQAFDELVERVGEQDAAVVYYAGHGSRLRDPAVPADATGDDVIIESMVAHDSGRDPHPNRDVLDREVDGFVRRLNAKTANVTLLFDCCHSGSVTRDLGAATTRQVEPDLRPSGQMFGPEGPPASPSAAPATRSLGLAESKGSSGWLPKRRTTLLAACRAEELANEHDAADSGDDVAHGALTYFLCRELLHARADTTWRDVFDKVAPAVHAAHRRQQPQMEGAPDRVLFGMSVQPPTSYLGVLAVRGELAKLGGGAAHGVTVGSRWAIHPHDAKRADAGGELAIVEVTGVAATESAAKVVGEPRGTVEAGQRAFEHEANVPALALSVKVEVPRAEHAEDGAELIRTLEGSPLVRLVQEEQPAAVSLSLVAPRAVVAAGDPLPRLGPLDTWTWAGVGGDGRLAVHLQPASSAGARNLLTELEAVARYRHLMSLDNRDPNSALAGKVELLVRRGVGGELRVAEAEEDGGMVLFEEGDVAEFEICNHHDRPVHVTLLEFGTDGAISVLLPDPECPPYKTASVVIAPGDTLRVGADHYEMPEGLELELPEGFPWAAEPGEEVAGAILTLKVIATLAPADFSGLEQGATRSLGDGHPLEELVSALNGGTATRGFRPKKKLRDRATADWAVVSRALAVRRPTAGQSLDPAGAPVSDGMGIVLHAPGLAGEVVFKRGDSARTRALSGTQDLFSRVLSEADLRCVADIELRDVAAVDSRDISAVPQTEEGEPAMQLELPGVGSGWVPVVLVADESGFVRWVRGDQTSAGGWHFEVPRPAVSAPGTSATRSLLGALGKRKLLKVITHNTAALQRVGRGFEWFEERFRPYGVRPFTAADYQLSARYGWSEAPGLLAAAGRLRAGDGATPLPDRLTEEQWRHLGAGPALLFIHGTFDTTQRAFAQLDEATVAALCGHYGGRVAAFDHPSQTVDAKENVHWFLSQLPADVSLELDVVAHSRGGLLGRALAAWAPQLTNGRVRVSKVVCVGSPHRGTPLLEARHLLQYVSLLTNAVNEEKEPDPANAVGVLEMLKAVLVEGSGELRGIQSMVPGSAFLAELAAAEQEHTSAQLYGVVSAFRAASGGVTSGLERLAEMLTARAFQEPNDVVVPTAGGHEGVASPLFPIPPERLLVLGAEDARLAVWHNAYFKLPQVRERLLSWLTG